MCTAAAGIIGLLYYNQTHLIYPAQFPQGSREVVAEPPEFGLTDYETVYLTTPDKLKLHCFYIKKPKSKITLLYLHANAGNMVFMTD